MPLDNSLPRIEPQLTPFAIQPNCRTRISASPSRWNAPASSPRATRLPHTSTLLQPLVATVPLQLLACELATELGHDVDQPRNLAKSVTVE